MTTTYATHAPAAAAVHAPKSQPIISVTGLEVEFPTLHGQSDLAIDALDLDIEQGEILGLVGESGAGKTTLARALLGLPPPPGRVSGGSVRFEGRDLLSLPESQLRALRGGALSMIVSNPRSELNPLVPVGEQIATMLQIHRGTSKREAMTAALEMLKAVQIPDPGARMKALPHELSGGMAQRVVIAIALICSPKFIVSDDATSGLDVTVQAQILALLEKLVRQDNRAMLFITRDIAITAHFCDRVAVLYRGQVMEVAPRQAFFMSPRHPTTIMLMTAFSHNERLHKMWKGPTTNLPAKGDGCVYSARCPLAQDRCRESRPPLTEISPQHKVRCYFPVPR